MNRLFLEHTISKEASLEKKAWLGTALTGLAKAIPSIAANAFNMAVKTAGIMVAGGAAVGAGAGYLAARATSPDLATTTTEQDLAQEALETEIDITRRQIAQLERRQKEAKKAAKMQQKVYDRFV